MAATLFKKYLLPGLVFQSVVIAGGYGTGRELVEFFLSHGPIGGLLAMLLATVIWSAVCAASYEFARTFRAYEYRAFFRRLLGPAWALFEVGYVVLLLIVLAIIAAAAGTILQETFNLPFAVGVIGIMAAVGYLVFRGSATIERMLSIWSGVLYAVFIVLFVWCFARFGDDIVGSLRAAEVTSGWLVGGVAYAGYNLAVIPAVLFTIRHAETRRDAVTAGALSGPVAMIPGLLFYLAMVGQYPAILERPVPANSLLEALGSKAFQVGFQVMLFGTLIETGTGLIHAVNERLAGVYAERQGVMPGWLRPAVALTLLVVATVLSRFGLINLIAKGYGTLTWLFIAIFVVPVLTWGVWKVVRVPRAAPLDR